MGKKRYTQMIQPNHMYTFQLGELFGNEIENYIVTEQVYVRRVLFTKKGEMVLYTKRPCRRYLWWNSELQVFIEGGKTGPNCNSILSNPKLYK